MTWMRELIGRVLLVLVLMVLLVLVLRTAHAYELAIWQATGANGLLAAMSRGDPA
jgi:hypothetical protein